MEMSLNAYLVPQIRPHIPPYDFGRIVGGFNRSTQYFAGVMPRVCVCEVLRPFFCEVSTKSARSVPKTFPSCAPALGRAGGGVKVT